MFNEDPEIKKLQTKIKELQSEKQEISAELEKVSDKLEAELKLKLDEFARTFVADHIDFLLMFAKHEGNCADNDRYNDESCIRCALLEAARNGYWSARSRGIKLVLE